MNRNRIATDVLRERVQKIFNTSPITELDNRLRYIVSTTLLVRLVKKRAS